MQATHRSLTPLGDYWRLLRRYLSQQRIAVLLMAGLLFASILAQLVAPQIVRRFIDLAQVAAPFPVLLGTALLFIGAISIQQVLRTLASYWSERVAWDATNALRSDIARHLLGLDMRFHTQHTSGELIERVDGDINALAGFFSAFTIELLGSVLLLVGIVVAVTLLDWRLGLAFGMLALFMPALLGRLRQYGVRHWQASREHSAAYYGFISEVLGAREDLRSSGAESYVLQRLLHQLGGWFPVARSAEVWGMIVWIAAVLLFALADGLAYGLGGTLFLQGAITLGSVYVLISYTAMLAAPLETLRTQLQDLQQADAAITRVRELLELRSSLMDGTAQIPAGPINVTFENVSFRYAAQELDPTSFVLQNLSFKLAAGQTLGLVGRTGSGKSTLARLLFRFYDPTAGSVQIQGVDVSQCSIRQLRQRVGLVTQDVQLFHASLRDNLTFFASQSDDQYLCEVLAELGLTSWLERQPKGLDTQIRPAQLSTGESQLLALARVFLRDPGLVILDEPSARIDPVTELMVQRAVERLLKGRTAIIIAHRLHTLERCDQILILQQGRMLEYGPPVILAADPNSQYTLLHHSRDRGDIYENLAK